MPAIRPRLPVGSVSPNWYARRGEPRLVAGGELRRAAQRRDGGVGHRHRAGVAHLDLRPAEVADGAADVRVRSGGGVRPRRAGQAVLHRGPHQLVPVRVELDLVDRGARTGRGSAASAGSRWPPAPTPAPARCRPAGRGRPGSRASRRRRGGRQASASTASPAIGSWPVSGGTWLVTSCVATHDRHRTTSPPDCRQARTARRRSASAATARRSTGSLDRGESRRDDGPMHFRHSPQSPGRVTTVTRRTRIIGRARARSGETEPFLTSAP